MNHNRRNFLKRALAVTVGALAAPLLKACGSSGSSSVALDKGDCTTGTITVVNSNHGHSFLVSTSDVSAGTAKDYSIQGTGDHDHTVSISAANFTTLQGGTAIELTSSSTNGHTHSVSVGCLAAS